MKFKKGDILVCADQERDTEYTFIAYNYLMPMLDCWVKHPILRGDIPANSTRFWFAKGRHLLTEVNREV